MPGNNAGTGGATMRPPVSMKPQELKVPEIRNAVERLKRSQTKRSKQKAFTKLSKVVDSYRTRQPAFQTRIVESNSRRPSTAQLLDRNGNILRSVSID